MIPKIVINPIQDDGEGESSLGKVYVAVSFKFHHCGICVTDSRVGKEVFCLVSSPKMLILKRVNTRALTSFK